MVLLSPTGVLPSLTFLQWCCISNWTEYCKGHSVNTYRVLQGLARGILWTATVKKRHQNRISVILLVYSSNETTTAGTGSQRIGRQSRHLHNCSNEGEKRQREMYQARRGCFFFHAKVLLTLPRSAQACKFELRSVLSQTVVWVHIGQAVRASNDYSLCLIVDRSFRIVTCDMSWRQF